MGKRKYLTHEEKILSALEKIQNPIVDKRHNLSIYFINDRARSNETRFEHISKISHKLKTNDLDRISKQINNKKTIFKRDKEHKDTFNYYVQRYSYTEEEFIKVSVLIDENNPKKGRVKTIFITGKQK